MVIPHQKQVLTQARMYTRRGWMHGTMRLVPGQTMVDFIERSHAFITLTQVRLAAYEQDIDYLSFQRSAIGLLVPPEGVEWKVRPQDLSQKQTRVMCLFEQGAVRGMLEIPTRVRVSDYFANREGFVQLTQVHMRLPNAQGERTNETHAVAIVNATHIMGVSEITQK